MSTTPVRVKPESDEVKDLGPIMPRANTEVETDVENLTRWRKLPLVRRQLVTHNVLPRLKISPSDPFERRRVMSHLVNGVHCPEDFGIQIRH